MKKIVIVIILLWNQGIQAQLSYPVSLYYGYCFITSAGASISSSSVPRWNTTTRWKSLIITKMQSTGYPVSVMPLFSGNNTGWCFDNQSLYMEVMTPSNLTSFPFNGGICNGGVSSTANFISTTAQNDNAYLNNCYSNSYAKSWVVSGVTYNDRCFDFKRNYEHNTDIKVWSLAGANGLGTASFIYHPSLKFLQTNKFIVTNPINWSSYTGYDYKYDGNSLSTSSLTGTKTSSIPSVCSGIQNPRIFLDLNTSLVDTLWNNVQPDRGIFALYLYKLIGSSWTQVSGSKSSITLDPGNSYMIRYFYQLSDDPYITSGAQYGYRDVYINTKKDALINDTTNQYYPSYLYICKNDSSYNGTSIKNHVLKTSAVNFYASVGDTLAWYIRLWQHGVGWYNSTVYASGKGNASFNFTSLAPNPTGTVYVIVMYATHSSLCQLQRTYERDFYIYQETKPSLGIDKTFCSTDANYTIPASPSGGTFHAITGLTGGVFNPKLGNTGVSQIIYTYTSPNGCVAKDTMLITVNANPKPSIGADQSFCQFTAANYTIPNSPVGGTFKTTAGGSVTGLTGSSFNPTIAGVGASTVIYEVNNSNGCLSYDTAVYITYANPKPSVGADQTMCNNANPITITPSITGGTFSTTNGLNTTTGVFTPSSSNLGTNGIVYTKNNGNGCINGDTALYTVYANPKPSIGADQYFCQFTAANYTIPNTPVGGTFKTTAGGLVTGLSGSSFNPTTAGVGASTVIYEVNNSNGCLNYDTAVYTTYANPKPNVGADQSICSNSAAYSIPNTPTGGSFNSVTGLSGNVFYPSAAAVGTSVIYYTVNNGNSCTNMDTVVMVVNSNPKPGIGSDQSFCQFTAANYTIPNSPVGGTFKTTAGGSVTGLTGSSYNPTTAGVGASTIIYEVNNSNGCLNYDTAVYTTYANPKPSVGADQSFCSNAATYSIPNTPTGGSFNSVSGLSGNVFSPSAALVGTSRIYYSVNNGNGCTNLDTVVMVVNSNPKPSIGSDQSFCQFTAANYTIPNTPVGGTFKTTAGGLVTGLSGSSFNPTTSGVGSSTVIYEVNNSNGCLNYDTAVYTTYANPKPSVGADQSFCSNTTTYSIPNTPTGGSFNTVTGLSGNLFYPSTAAVGTSAIYYTVNNGNGCGNIDTTEYTVHAKPSTPSYIKHVDSVCTIQGNAANNLTLKTFFSISTGSGISETWVGSSQSGGVVDIHSLVPGQWYGFLFVQTNGSQCKDTSYFSLKSNNGSDQVVQLSKNYDTICHSLSSIDLKGYNNNVRNGHWSYPTSPSFIQNNRDLLVNLLPLEQIVQLIYRADTNGCPVSKTMSLLRHHPTVHAGIDKNICSNGNVEVLAGTPSGGVWSIDTIGNYLHVFNPATLSVAQSQNAKNYNLFYSRNENGCSSTDTAVYTIVKKPTVTFVKNGDSVCIGLRSLDLTTHFGVNPISGIWKGANLNNSVLDLVASGVGIKNFFYIIQNTVGCLDTSYYSVRVDDNISAGLLDTSDFKVCEASSPIQLNQFKTALSQGTWTGTSIIDTLFYPTSSGVGNFNIQYTTRNKSCSFALHKRIWVVARPAIPELIGEGAYCKNSLFNVSIKNPDPTLIYKWRYGSNSYNGTQLVGTVNEDLNIDVIALNYLNCESFKATKSLALDEPTATISTDKDVVENGKEISFSLNSPSHIVSARWNFGDGAEVFDSMNISRIFYNPSMISAKDYTVECEIKSGTGCRAILKRIITVVRRTSSVIEPIDGQQQIGDKIIISIFPNPAREYLDILITRDPSLSRTLALSMFDFRGRLIYSGQVHESLRIDVSGYPVGVYYVKIGEEEGVKVVIER